jgi:ABC-type multidrug transport system fused ATPase/permease subunit
MTTYSKIRELLAPAERRSALALLGLMVVGMMLETLGIGLVIPAITLLMQGDLAARFPALLPVLNHLGNPTQTQLVVGAMVGLVGVYLVKNLFLAFLAWRQTRFAFGVQAHLSQRLFSNYLRQPYTFHLQRNSAQLIRNVTTEVNLFSSHALIPGMLLFTEGSVMLGIGGLLLFVEPLGATLVVLVIGGSAWAFYHATRLRINRWGAERQLHEGMRLQHLQQGLGGAKDVKLLGREEDFLAQYEQHNLRSAHAAQLQVALQQFPRLSLEFLALTGLAILVISMTLQGRDMAGIVPTLGLFAAAAFRLMPSMNRLLGAVQTLRFMLPVINTLHAELQLAPSESAVIKNVDSKPFQSEVSLVDISFTYPAAQSPSLRGLSLTIKKGETIGFIGSSGSGKSTLIDVMLGLLPPATGKILVDGQDVQNNLRSWQNQIGYVPQSIYLTDDTLRRNVAFGLPESQIDDLAVQKAITAAQLEEFVATLPDGMNTMVGERGIRLSGGQRQRIGIARALYHDPVVLVLDEATSALDAETEQGVMEAVNVLHGSKTIVIVAHRLSTVESCDHLYRLDSGRVIDEGSTSTMLWQAASFEKIESRITD